jgi:hypothetical protein
LLGYVATGGWATATTTALTPHETASLLSFAATASPPDRTLLEEVDSLTTAVGRERQVRRLLPTIAARRRLVRVVREWLGTDGIAEIDKDSNVYPSFALHRRAIIAESVGFIDEVLSNGTGTVEELLGAGWTLVGTDQGVTDAEIDAYYASYYGVDSGGPGRTSLDGARGGARIGILNQGAFLTRFATATGSHPVLRGVALMRRIACLELPNPVELSLDVAPPAADPNAPRTTRELYSVHASDERCRSCHQTIDGSGSAPFAKTGSKRCVVLRAR